MSFSCLHALTTHFPHAVPFCSGARGVLASRQCHFHLNVFISWLEFRAIVAPEFHHVHTTHVLCLSVHAKCHAQALVFALLFRLHRAWHARTFVCLHHEVPMAAHCRGRAWRTSLGAVAKSLTAHLNFLKIFNDFAPDTHVPACFVPSSHLCTFFSCATSSCTCHGTECKHVSMFCMFLNDECTH